MVQKMKKKTLALFTAYFPFSRFEVYMESEIKALSSVFDEIHIFPLKEDSCLRDIPPNCKVHLISKSTAIKTSASNIITHNFWGCIFLLYKEFSRIGIRQFMLNHKFLIRSILNYHRFSAAVKNIMESEEISPDVFYSNWMVDWAVVLSLLKKDGVQGKFICRSHRYDLYDEKNNIGFVPFAGTVISTVNKIFSISEDGTDYLKKKYPSAAAEIITSRLGVFDKGINAVISNDPSVLHLVTCSNIIPVKRLHLVVEALGKVKKNVIWNHFGDGVLRDEIIEMAKITLGMNISFINHGRISSDQLMEFYRNNPVDLFLNVSESEGIPVSIMEAVSFGIPVIATDVGGSREIVNENTGILLKKDFHISQLTDLLNAFSESPFVQISFRQGVRKFWEENFNAELNFKEFAREISNV
jgi:glycosyltransferase involved in cell wall biosynthesis